MFDNKITNQNNMPGIRKPKLLVVDDVEENIFSVTKVLKKLDCEVIPARSGSEALSLTLRHDFAVILMDVQMPILNGFETASILRDNEETKHIPIIFVTAINKDQRYVDQGYATGAVDYLFKPLDQDLLLAKVNVFLELDRKSLSLKKALAKVNELNYRHSLLLETIGEGIVGIDSQGAIIFVNPAAQHALGEDKGVGTNISQVFSRQPSAQLGHQLDNQLNWLELPFQEAIEHSEQLHDDSLMMHRGTKCFPVEVTFAPFSAEFGSSGGVLVFQDITRRKQIEETLMRMAKFDMLTELPNRSFFNDMLSSCLAKAERQNSLLCILFIDLDGFKAVNDTLGHNAGDSLLRAFSQRLTASLRKGDFVSRIAGDEFVVLIDDVKDKSFCELMAQKFIDLTDKPFDLVEGEAVIGLSVGIACYPENGADMKSLMLASDEAMYRAKRGGKNCFSW